VSSFLTNISPGSETGSDPLNSPISVQVPFATPVVKIAENLAMSDLVPVLHFAVMASRAISPTNSVSLLASPDTNTPVPTAM